MKKVLFLAAAMTMAFAMSANAKIFEDNHVTVNANIGGFSNAGYSQAGFGLGVGFQTGIYENDWISLSWDVLHFEWDAPFNSPGDVDYLNFKSGIRAFSPSFANDHLRAYTNLAMGLSVVLMKDYDVDYDDDSFDVDIESKMKGHCGFGLTWGIGLQLNKKFSFGYNLLYESWGKTKGHFGTISYTF
jgi:hypothetical protein